MREPELAIRDWDHGSERPETGSGERARMANQGSRIPSPGGGIQMRTMRHVLAATAFAALGTLVAFAQAPQQPAGGAAAGQGRGGGPAGPASVFITRVGRGGGGGRREPPRGLTWRAYLSPPAAGGQPAVNARDRIGAGPWFNARGQLI